jgi:F0F1-type ATP synthase membrane subunit b/b'
VRSAARLLVLAWLVLAGAGTAAPTFASPATHDSQSPAEQGTGEGVHGAHGEPGGDAHAGKHELHGLGDVNLIYGILGEKEGLEEPTLLWRPPGMGVPYAVMVLNTAVLFLLFYHYGRRPLREALRKRGEGIMRGMSEAGKMKEEAALRLQEYRDKLAHLDDEIERVKRELREAGEAERERVLREAREKQKRIERDARLVIESELKAAREQLAADAVRSATRAAAALLESQVTATDHDRLGQEYIEAIRRSPTGMGGRA